MVKLSNWVRTTPCSSIEKRETSLHETWKREIAQLVYLCRSILPGVTVARDNVDGK